MQLTAKVGVVVCLLTALLATGGAQTEPGSDTSEWRSVFPDRSHFPGLNSTAKCWWAKEITPDLHISGRLTERQIKYAADAGFRSVVSLFTYANDDQGRGTFGGDVLPTTEEARRVAEDVAGMTFVSVLGEGDRAWNNVQTVATLTQVLADVPKPALLYCNRGYSMTLVTLMYLANQTRVDASFTPRISTTRVYDIAAAMGYDFTSPALQAVVSEVTGEPVPGDITRPNAEPLDWRAYWLAHPVYKNWYTAGQITRAELEVLRQAGFKTIINMRSGPLTFGLPSQEEVNLLNIQMLTGTYPAQGRAARQTQERLEETRIDPSRSTDFIGPNSTVNYESRNAEEFGDDVGYFEPAEKQTFEEFGSELQYYHMPTLLQGPYSEYMEQNIDKLLEIGKKGPVLVHCMVGMRAAYVTTLVAAIQYDKDLDWALQRTRELSYSVAGGNAIFPELYSTYVDWLGTRRQASPLVGR